ncbi:MAG: sugar ABC transporter substrate-binding protein [Christensenellales bacterium]
MKKHFALLLVVLMIIGVLAGCAQPAPVGTSAPAQTQAPATAAPATQAPTIAPKTFKVGWSIDTITSDFNAAADKRIKAYFAEKYPEVELFSAEAGGQALQQVADVEDLMAKKVDLLLVKPKDEATLAATLKAAQAAGIIVVLFDRYVQGDPYDVFVGCDDVETGRILAESLCQKLNGKGQVLLAEGTAGASAYMDRIKGIKEVLAKYPNVQILASQTSVAKREDSKALMENWIQAYKGKFNAVIALTDATTMGFLQAMEENGIKDVVVCSINGSMEALKAVVDGKIHVEVAVSSSIIPAIPVAYAMLTGDKTMPKKIISPPFVVTPENATQYYDAKLFRFDEFDPLNNPLVKGCIDRYPELKGLEIR